MAAGDKSSFDITPAKWTGCNAYETVCEIWRFAKICEEGISFISVFQPRLHSHYLAVSRQYWDVLIKPLTTWFTEEILRKKATADTLSKIGRTDKAERLCHEQQRWDQELVRLEESTNSLWRHLEGVRPRQNWYLQTIFDIVLEAIGPDLEAQVNESPTLMR